MDMEAITENEEVQDENERFPEICAFIMSSFLQKNRMPMIRFTMEYRSSNRKSI